MKKHSILKVVLLTILFVTVCTWIFPVISFNSELVEDVRYQVGLFDIGSYLVEVLRYFPYVLTLVLSTGMFYGVCNKIPAYRALLDKIVLGFKGKENIFLAVMMVLIAVIVSVSGLSLGIIFVFPFVISLVLLMGYNKLVAASVTVGSTMVGILGTTLGTDTIYYIMSALGTEPFTEIITKIALLVIGLVLLIFNVLHYANKTKNGVDKVVNFVPKALFKNKEKKEVKEEKVTKAKTETKKKETKKKEVKKDTKTTKTTKKSTKTTAKKKTTKTRAFALRKKNDDVVVVKKDKKPSIWPFVVIFDLVLILICVATFNWADVCNTDLFETVLTAVTEYEINRFPIFAKILGNIGSFGNWSLNYEIPTIIILAMGLIAFIYRLKFDEVIDGCVEGVKKAIMPAIYMILAYLVLVIVTYNPFQLHFTRFLLELTNDFNVITMTLIMMISSIFNVETVYVAQSTLPYVTSVITDTTLYPVLAVLVQAVYGLVMLVAPTSVVLLGTLSYLDISYGQWLKHIWKLFLELLVVLVIIFLILLLI